MADGPTLNLIPPEQADKYREVDAVVNPRAQFDDATLYVMPQPITTASEDRQGEIIQPKGGILTMHIDNPVVCWQHSHKLKPEILPIARAEKPDGTYDVFEQDGVLYSGCTFSQATKLAYQVYACIREGMIRARSIGAIGHRLKEYTPQSPGEVMYEGRILPARTKSVIYELWELLEWSWVIIPANRDIVMAVKSYLSKPHKGIDRIDPFLEQTLKSLDLSEPVQVPGFDFTLKQFGDVDLKVPKQLVSGVPDMKGAAFVLFNLTQVTPGAAKAFLQNNPDLVDSPIKFDPVHKAMKSVQVEYDGPVELRSVDGVPGITVGLIKCDQPAVPAAKSNDLPILPVNGQAPGQPGAPGAAAKEADPAAAGPVAPDLEVKDPVPEYNGKPGSKLLQALNTQLTDVVTMLRAAITEQEDVPAKAVAETALEELTELQKTIASSHDTEYPDGTVKLMKEGTTDAEGAVAEKPVEEPASEEVSKSLISKFYGVNTRVPVPKVVAKALETALKGIPETKDTTAGRSILAQMVKGVVPSLEAPSGEAAAKQKLAQRVRRLEMAGKLKGIVPSTET